MSFTGFVIYYLAKCLEGGLFGELAALLLVHASFKIDNNPIPGIYSGLFAIHLACHATKRETDSSKPNIIFYALCVLYVLTGIVVAIDIVPIFVSNFIFLNLGLIQLCRMISL